MTLLEEIICKLIKRFTTKRKKVEKWVSPIAPKLKKQLDAMLFNSPKIKPKSTLSFAKCSNFFSRCLN